MENKCFYFNDKGIHKIRKITLNNNLNEVGIGTLGSKLTTEKKEYPLTEESTNAFNKEVQKLINLKYLEIPIERFEQYEQILNLMAHLEEMGHARKGFLALVEKKIGSLTDSKYGGKPYLHKDEEWPCCESCKEPLSFILQVNMEFIPNKIKNIFGINSGLLQFFYCTSDDGAVTQYPEDGNKKVQLVRFIENDKIAQDTKIQLPENMGLYPENLITGWEDIGYEYPYEGENKLGDLNILELTETKKFTDKIPERLISFFLAKKDPRVDCLLEVELEPENFDEYYDFILSEFIEQSEKIGGWPYWIQGSEYPNCPECKNKMSYLMQVLTSGYVPFSLYGGYGYIFICKNHKDQAWFLWQCD